MNRYVVTLRHGKGRIRILTSASSPEQAAKQVCSFELAPPSAVLSVIAS